MGKTAAASVQMMETYLHRLKNIKVTFMHLAPVLISSTKMTTKNIRQLTFFMWLRRDVDELKLLSDDKNYE